MALFRTDSDHVELDEVSNHGKHPMIFVYSVFGYMAVYSFRLLDYSCLLRVLIILHERNLAAVEEVVYPFLSMFVDVSPIISRVFSVFQMVSTSQGETRNPQINRWKCLEVAFG